MVCRIRFFRFFKILATFFGAALVTASLANGQQPQPAEQRLLQLGAADQISLQVFGQPDMTVTAYVSDDGTIPIPLAGAVKVIGLSPSEAAREVEKALKNGGFLVDPHVTISVLQSRSQRVSVLGEVRTPGRYVVESNTTIFDLLAQAGGTTDLGADIVYILRPTAAGTTERIELNLKEFANSHQPGGTLRLRTGDSVLIPKAEKFYILGEVNAPNAYKLHPGMTVLQAITLAGGLTETASTRRIEIKRTEANGKVVTQRAQLTDTVKPDDVIRIKESIF